MKKKNKVLYFQKKTEIFLALNIPIESIFIENIRYGSICINTIIRDYLINDEELAK